MMSYIYLFIFNESQDDAETFLLDALIRYHIVPQVVVLDRFFPTSPSILSKPTMLTGQWLKLWKDARNGS